MRRWLGTSANRLRDIHVLWRYLSRETILGPSDLIIAFGSESLSVARKAGELWRAGVAPWVLVTGGSSAVFGPRRTEADAYAEALRAQGVAREAIIVERAASNTGENVALGMTAAAARGVEVRRATLVAFPTSVRRCAATFAWRFPRLRLGARMAFRGLGPFRSDSEGAVAEALSEIERLRRYPSLGYFAPQRLPGDVEEAAGRLAATTAARR